MTELSLAIIALAIVLTAVNVLVFLKSRRNAARNAAYAECVECPHKTAPDALAAAHSAALAHRSDTGHHVMIVKA